MLDPAFVMPRHHTSSCLRNEDPSTFETAHGMPFWDFVGHNPKVSNFLNEGMASDTRLITSVLINKARKEVFNGLNSIVDVGGGTETMAKSITEAFPNIECTVLDLPHVVAGLHNSPNLKYVAGNMFESIPLADAILLKWILHDWKDGECVKILEQCKTAIKEREGGKVIIIEMVKGNQKMDDEDIGTQLSLDMLMMMVFNAKERNEKEWAKLFSDTGFSGYKIIPILDLRSVIEVYP